MTYQSQVLFDPDLVAELFVFDSAADGGNAEIVATAHSQLNGSTYGVDQNDTGATTEAAATSEHELPQEEPDAHYRRCACWACR